MTSRTLTDPLRILPGGALNQPAERRPLEKPPEAGPFELAMRAQRKTDAGRKGGAQQSTVEPKRQDDRPDLDASRGRAAGAAEPAEPAGVHRGQTRAAGTGDGATAGAAAEEAHERATTDEPSGETKEPGPVASAEGIEELPADERPMADDGQAEVAATGGEDPAPHIADVDPDGSRRNGGGTGRAPGSEGSGDAADGHDGEREGAAEARGATPAKPLTIHALNDLLARADKALLLRVSGLSAGRVGVSMSGFTGAAERTEAAGAEPVGAPAPGPASSAAPIGMPQQVPPSVGAPGEAVGGGGPPVATERTGGTPVPEPVEAASPPAASGAKPAAGAAEPSGVGAATAVFRLVSEGRSAAAHSVRGGVATPSGPSPEVMEAQVARGLAAALQQRGGSVTLRLHPEVLGQLRVQMEVSGGLVSVRLEVGSGQARDLLDATVANLRSSLEAKGLNVAKLEVQVDPSLSRPAGEPAGRHGSEGPEDPGRQGGGGAEGGGTLGGQSGSAGREAGPGGAWRRAGGAPEEPGAERPADMTELKAAPGHGVLDRVTLRLDAVA
ncbi:MAG: flagellar hook-length control protein FliK [Phycisphaerae bacterium]|nr:flagellar hook-length control protein FliK [Phycisphaerae bacterium]